MAVVVCSPERGDPLRRLGGLTLLERLLRQLSEGGALDSIAVVGDSRERLAGAVTSAVRCPVRIVESRHSHPWTMAAEAVTAASTDAIRRVIVIAGDLLVDQRLVDELIGAETDVLIQSDHSLPPEILGSLDRAALLGPARGGTAPAARTRPIDTFDTYVRHQRGHVPLHLLAVRSEADIERGWALLFDHVEKRTKDLPATYFDPPFENFLVRILAPTPVTPNQVTLATGVLGFFVAWLFFHGMLISGALLAIAVEVLDGVDGKLARIKRMISKAGELEHVLDFFYECSWYLALGAYFAATGSPWAWAAAWSLCVADAADNLAYVHYARRIGGASWRDYLPSLDDSTAFLRRFRLIGGRRNIYVWLMLPGFVAGLGEIAFAAAVAWGAITAATHWAVGHFVSRTRAPARRRPHPAAAPALGAHASRHTPPFQARSRRSDSVEPRSQPSDRPRQAAQGR
jgi:phosphatidylglycerophosphate synthase